MTREPRLLVIDDEPEIGKLVCTVARSSGYDARATTEPEAFKAMYRDWRPDAVVLDVQIPETDGIELLRFLADEQSRSRVFLVSGMDTGMLEVVNRLGVVFGLDLAATMQKPIRAAELRNALREALSEPDPSSGD